MSAIGRITPHSDFRENPSRALYVDQPIDGDLLRRLTREYHALKSHSLEPISVYICSPGGSVKVFGWIKDVLWACDQSGQRPRIITIVKGMAASAAARLLVLGDYSMSYPSSLIHCHGTRLQSVDHVTRERAEDISRQMEDSNRATADEFVGRILSNLAFLYDANRSAILKVAKDEGINAMVAFAIVISEKIGDGAKLMMDDVFLDLAESQRLDEFLSHKKRATALKKAENKSRTDLERTLLKHIIDFLFIYEWKEKDKLTDEFSQDLRRLFKSRKEYFESLKTGLNHCNKVIPLLLDQVEFGEYEKAVDSDNVGDFIRVKIAPLLIPLWQLASSISNRLVMGENPLSAIDAYWLGLIQEVVGSNLPCYRNIAENNAIQKTSPKKKMVKKAASK